MVSKIFKGWQIAIILGLIFPASTSMAYITQSLPTYHLLWQYGNGIATDIVWNPVAQELMIGTSHGIWSTSVVSLQMPARFSQRPSYVESLRVSPDGMLVASSSSDKIEIYDVRTNEVVSTLSQFSTRSMAWHPTQPILATGTDVDGSPAVVLWNTLSGQPTAVLKGYSDRVVALSWHPDGKLLAVGLRSGQIIIENVNTAQRIHELSIPSSALRTVVWNSDGTMLAAAGSAQPAFALWYTDTFEPISLTNLPDFIGSLTWEPDRQQLAGVLDGGTAAVWTMTDNKLTQLSDGTGGVVNAVVWLQGKLATLDRTGKIQIWNESSGVLAGETNQFVGSIWHVAAHFQSNQLAFAYRHSTAIYVIDGEKGQLYRVLETPSQVAPLSLTDVAWSPQARWLAVAFDTALNIWPMADTSASPIVINLEGRALQLVWNSANSLAVALSTPAQRELLLVDPEHGSIENLIPVEGLTAMQWNPGGQQVALLVHNAASDIPTPLYQIQLMDVEAGKITATLKFPEDMVPMSQFAWLPDSSGLLGIECSVTTNACSIWEWQNVSGDEARTFLSEPEGVNLKFAQISISPDGLWLAASDSLANKVYIFDLITGECLLTLDEFANPVDFLAWSGTNELIVSDGVIQAFQLELPNTLVRESHHLGARH